MKSRQVLLLYRKGRRDFRGQNFRGQSFRAQDLSGADFSYSDLQGANFYRANLQNTQFRGIKAGLQKRWQLILLFVSWFLSVFSGLGLVLISYFTLLVLDLSSPDDSSVGWNTLLLTIAFVFIAIRQLIGGSLGTIAATVVVAVIGIITSATAGITQMATFIGTLGIAGALAGFAIAVVLTSAVAFAVAFAVSPKAAIILAVARTVAVATVPSIIASYISGSLSAVAITAAVSVSFFFDYLGWRSLQGGGRYAGIQTIAVNLAAVGGTSFRKTNLTDADFTNAVIPSTDFSHAKLVRTCWKGVRQFDRIRTGNTHLKYRPLRELLRTGNGKNQNFDHQDLRWLNLQGANLTNASFIAANLSHSNLKNANLTGAKFVRTQLDKTDLNQTLLTRAFIQNWIITTRTKLEGIQCDYIFTRFPSLDSSDPNPHRQPEDWNQTFKPGEFTDYILQKLYDRVDPDKTQLQLATTQLQTVDPFQEIATYLRQWMIQLPENTTHTLISDQINQALELLDNIENNPQLKQQFLSVHQNNLFLNQDLFTQVLTFITLSSHYLNEAEAE